MTNNEMMKSHLQSLVIEPLLKKGFTGKYPHFRKAYTDCIELISFQSNKHGGSFTIEVSAVFPNHTNKNYVTWEGLTEDQLNVWSTNERYRLKGMFDGWFYYRDVYTKRIQGLGRMYFDADEKQADEFSVTKGYKPVQKFDNKTAVEICNEVNRQLTKAFKWLERFKKRNMRHT